MRSVADTGDHGHVHMGTPWDIGPDVGCVRPFGRRGSRATTSRGNPVRRWMVLAAAMVLAGAACGAPGVEVFPSPNASLAVRPSAAISAANSPPAQSAPPEPAPSGTASLDPSAPPVPADPDRQQAVPDPSLTPDTAVPTVFRPVGGINDAQGDLPRGAPAWADIIGLVLEDDGTTLRIRIDLADGLPTELRNNETARIGVDLFRGNGGETRYRVFLDGTADGWLAYLQRPDGFIGYPGSVTIAGSNLTLALPAAAVGDPVRGDWRAFSEWSGPGGGGREARDAAPDEGWGTFTR